MLCSASEIQFGPEKIPAYGWKSAFLCLFCFNKVMLLVFIAPPNYTTDIFFSEMQMLNICSHLKHLWGSFNCDACGNAHNRPACQPLDCTLLWGCCLFLLLKLVHKHMCVVIFHFFEKGVTVYHDMCLKQGYYLFMKILRVKLRSHLQGHTPQIHHLSTNLHCSLLILTVSSASCH